MRYILMEEMIFSHAERETRRRFIKKTMLGAACISAGGLMAQGCARFSQSGITGARRDIILENEKNPRGKKEKSILSFAPSSSSARNSS